MKTKTACFALAALLLVCRVTASQVYDAGNPDVCTLEGDCARETGYAGCTGQGAAAMRGGGGITFIISVPAAASYDLVFRYQTMGGDKTNDVLVDGQPSGPLVLKDAGAFADHTYPAVHLDAGTHRVKIAKNWGYIVLDSLTVRDAAGVDAAVYQVSRQLANPNANDITRRLFAFLADSFGKKIITGQQYNNSSMSDADSIRGKTGKYPALMGFDFMDDSPGRVEHGASSNNTQLAVDWWNAGGIVTFCWHWGVHSQYERGNWWSDFYSDHVTPAFDLYQIMNGENPAAYDQIVGDIDAIAQKLKVLQAAGVPVLWRPLHEAAGGWFWWGRASTVGDDARKKERARLAYLQLWNLMYDRMTNTHGLNNLIWVWNGQDKDWYPGDGKCDVIGMDIYAGSHNPASQVAAFIEMSTWTGARKLIALTENESIPAVANLGRDNVWWSYFCVWNGLVHRTDDAVITAMYGSPNAYTRSNLPDLRNYPVTPVNAP